MERTSTQPLLKRSTAALHVRVAGGNFAEVWTADLTRRWSASLLLVATISATLAFSLATLVGNWPVMSPIDLGKACFNNTRCPSNESYHAETVSEMVSKPSEPASKLFVAFTAIAAVALIASRYPLELNNVRTAQIKVNCLDPVLAVVPPVGMLIVAFVPVVPQVERISPGILLAVSVHTLGAILFVGGYNVFESITLCRLWHLLDKRQRWWRRFCVICSFLSIFTFEICGFLYRCDWALNCVWKLLFSSCVKLGHHDTYQNATTAFRELYPNARDTPDAMIIETYGNEVLVDTATDFIRWVKRIEFWGEELAGIFIIASHFLIWFYSGSTGMRHDRFHEIELDAKLEESEADADPRRVEFAEGS